MLPILKESLAKRGIDIKCLSEDATIESNNQASKEIIVNEGISQDIGRMINQTVKSSKIKVQSSIQGDTVRISGKKRDDLQSIMAEIKSLDIELPLQFKNFRD